MSVPLFHPNNTFHIYKNNQDLKTINFSGHKVGLYYKLYSILRKKHNYHLRTATVMTLTSRILMQGNFFDIYEALISELKDEHKFSIITRNSENGDVYHWCDDTVRVLEQLEYFKEKYTRSADERLFVPVTVENNETGSKYIGTINELIETFSTKEDADEETECEEAAFGVYLSFEEVLAEMRPLIMNGTDKEKIEAKAILAYVATKLAEK